MEILLQGKRLWKYADAHAQRGGSMKLYGQRSEVEEKKMEFIAGIHSDLSG